MVTNASRVILLVLVVTLLCFQGLLVSTSGSTRGLTGLDQVNTNTPDCPVTSKIVLNVVVRRNPPAIRLIFVDIQPKAFDRYSLRTVFGCLSSQFMQPEMLCIIARSNQESLNRWIQHYLSTNSIRIDGSFERRSTLPPTEPPDDLRSETGFYRAEYSRTAFSENFSYSPSPDNARLVNQTLRMNLRYRITGDASQRTSFSYIATGEPKDDLVLASRLGLDDEIRRIVKNGASVNASDRFGNYPLIEAILSRHFATARILLDSGADINQQSFAGWSVLMCALDTGNEQLAEDLLRRGAAVNAKADNSDTPLIIATERGLAHSVEQLLRAGASVDVKDKFGRTPELIARENQDTTTLKLLMRASKRK